MNALLHGRIALSAAALLRRRVALIAAAALLALGTVALAAGPKGVAAPAPAAQGAQALDAAFKKALEAGDLEAVVACYADDAVLWLPEAPEARGRDAIRRAYFSMLSGMKLKLERNGTAYAASGDVSSTWGRYRLTLIPNAGGQPVALTGRFTAVARKVGKGWVYVADHASADPVPGPDPGAFH